MNCRLVAAVVLGLALIGCAQGRSAQAPERPGAMASEHPVIPLHPTLNAGLPQSPTTSARVAAIPNTSSGAQTALPPVGLTPLPSIHASINGGLPTPATAGPRAVPQTIPAPTLATNSTSNSPATAPFELPVLPAPTPADAGKAPEGSATQDAAVVPVTSEPQALRSELGPGVLVGLSVAMVDGEHITLAELVAGVEDYKAMYVPEQHVLSEEEQNALAGIILQQLIDRTLLVQEAKRKLLTNDQKQKMFQDYANKQWQEQEIPKLCRKNKVNNEFELRGVLEKKSSSIDLMRDAFIKSTMAREFLQMQLQSRMTAPRSPHQLMAYYRDHLDEFHQKAQVNWREIVIKLGPNGSRAEARRKAEALLGDLQRGADFATVAREHSQGPTAPKGGLWETEPGASIAPAVNDALVRLPLQQISALLEGPQGFHIVRVEDRRAAGPKPFEIVQGEIATKLQEEVFQRETETYITALRSRAIITSPFKGTASAPPSLRDDQAKRTSAVRP